MFDYVACQKIVKNMTSVYLVKFTQLEFHQVFSRRETAFDRRGKLFELNFFKTKHFPIVPQAKGSFFQNWQKIDTLPVYNIPLFKN